MEIAIEEIILKEKEIAEEFQRVVDTHMASEDISLEELYCDDSEVIEEELERCKVLSDYHNTIANTMRKYREIEEVIKDWEDGRFSDAVGCLRVKAVIEDGKID